MPSCLDRYFVARNVGRWVLLPHPIGFLPTRPASKGTRLSRPKQALKPARARRPAGSSREVSSLTAFDRLKRAVKVLWALAWHLGLGPVVKAFRQSRPGLRILLYHRVSREPGGELAVTPEALDRQLRLVLASGRRIVPLSQVPALLRTGVRGSSPSDTLSSDSLDRLVVLTFDDGYLDNLTQALPVLRRHGVPAAVFVPTTFPGSDRPFPWMADLGVDEDRDPESRPLSWDELRELAARGVEIHSHGLSHADLTHLPPAEVRDEMLVSAGVIEREIGRRPTAFCYPFGFFAAEVVSLAAGTGYEMACTCRPGVNDGATPLHLLRRTMVETTDTPAVFRARLDGAFDRPFPSGPKNLLKGMLGRRR